VTSQQTVEAAGQANGPVGAGGAAPLSIAAVAAQRGYRGGAGRVAARRIRGSPCSSARRPRSPGWSRSTDGGTGASDPAPTDWSPPWELIVLFRLGRMVGTRGPGLVVLIPIVDRPVLVDLREQYLEIPRQTAITEDNATISIDFIIFTRVIDAVASVVRVQYFAGAAQNIAATTLRSVVGDMSLDEVLSKREQMNEQLRAKLDEVSRIRTWRLARDTSLRVSVMLFVMWGLGAASGSGRSARRRPGRRRGPGTAARASGAAPRRWPGGRSTAPPARAALPAGGCRPAGRR
jgi:hypothetical protein